jgi:TRAP-type C4-dicarboxylate transport system permease small subunit
MKKIQSLFFHLDEVLHNILYWALLVSILSILFLSSLNIILRWLEMALMWADPVVRHLVFITAFLGAAYATGRNQHIRVDLLARFLESYRPELRAQIDRVISFITCGICFWLAHSGYQFALMEYEFGNIAFLGIKTATMVMIIPLGMSLIGLRFFFFAIHGQTMKSENNLPGEV